MISILRDRRIVVASPEEIWRSHKSQLGVSRDEFDGYFGEALTACAIFFQIVEDVSPGVALSEIRSKSPGFMRRSSLRDRAKEARNWPYFAVG
jgi:hypothetical protein